MISYYPHSKRMNACHPSFIGSSFVSNQNDFVGNGKAATRVPIRKSNPTPGKQNAAIKRAFCLINSPFLPLPPLVTAFSFPVTQMTRAGNHHGGWRDGGRCEICGASHAILRNSNDRSTLLSPLFTDDIITPVYVAPTRSPTTFRPKHHKENIQERPSCDDEEDCEEGSGEPVTTEEIFVTSATGPFHFTFTGFASFAADTRRICPRIEFNLSRFVLSS